MRKLLSCLILLSAGATLRADFTYQETTQMTGGALLTMMRFGGPFTKQAREPILSTHMIQGNRMVTMTKDRSTVIDLDKESITTIDLGKKTYSVMTFAEMKQTMEDARQRMEQRRSQNPPSGDPNVEADFKVSAKATGQSKTIQGLNAKEMLITMAVEGTNTKTGESGAMTITTDTWMANVPGYDEVKNFHKRMAEKMGYLFGSDMAQMGMMRPDVGKGFEQVAKEMGKLDGVPVESLIKIGGTANSAPDSSSGSEQRSQQQQQQQQASTPATPGAALGRLAGGLGGFGGFGRKKKSDDQQQPAADQPQQGSSSASGTLIETTTALTSYASGPVDASKFEVPAGFKQVQPDIRRGAQ